MACGTGKTFTWLRIAEEHAGPGKAVLFLAPAIALVLQPLKEWTAECDVPIRPFVVCSDATAGKPIEGENATPFDLPIPLTTSTEAASALVTTGGKSNCSVRPSCSARYRDVRFSVRRRGKDANQCCGGSRSTCVGHSAV